MEENREEFQQAFSKTLRSLRNTAGLSQSELAKRMAVPLTQYVYYELGKIVPDSFVLKKMAEVLGVDVSVFFYPDRNPTATHCL